MTPPPPQVPPAPRTDAPSEQRWLKTAGEAVGLIAGAVALVYLLGGVLYALRLAFDGFSVEAIVGLTVGKSECDGEVTAH